MANSNHRPGGEFAGAWQSVTAASGWNVRRYSGPYANYTTQELIRDLSSDTMDDETRKAIQAEVDRRNSLKAKRRSRKGDQS